MLMFAMIIDLEGNMRLLLYHLPGGGGGVCGVYLLIY